MRTTTEQALDVPVAETPSVAILASESTTYTQASSASEITYEQEVHVRADTITGVLSKIMGQPSVHRNWGINE